MRPIAQLPGNWSSTTELESEEMVAHVRVWPSEGGGSIGRATGRVETFCAVLTPERSLQPYKHLRAAGPRPGGPAADTLAATGKLLLPSRLGAADKPRRERSGRIGRSRGLLQELRVRRQQTLSKDAPTGRTAWASCI